MNKHKIILLITLVSLLISLSCFRSKLISQVTTIIEDDDGRKISINFPTTNINKIDRKIEKYINNLYEGFINGSNEELNIDYKYHLHNNDTISIVIISTIDTQVNIKTFVFDRYNFNLLYLTDFIDEDTIIKLVNNYLVNINSKKINKIDLNNFYFDDTNLHIILKECNFLDIPIPLEKINLESSITTVADNVDLPYKTIDPNQKAIALTFDDGPTKYTKDAIRILKKYNANATFFILGNKVEIYYDTLKEMLKNGNEIGNHSYNHKWLTRLTDDEILYQIEETQKIIKNKLGYTPTVLRPTYGAVNNHLRNLSPLEIIMWDVDPQDWHAKSSKYIANNIINNAKDGDIIILHDASAKTVKSLELFIPQLMEEGYQFVTVSELKEIKNYRKKTHND